MYSMTGYGKSEISLDGRTVTVELKTVNNRFLDISIKLPKTFFAFEEGIRKQISKHVRRGRVDVFVNYKDLRDIEKKVEVDLALARGYLAAKELLIKEFSLTDDFTVTNLLRSNEIVKAENAEDDEEIIQRMLLDCVEEACVHLNQMRQTEGNSLIADICQKVNDIEGWVSKIKSFAPMIIADYSAKLRTKVENYLQQVAFDESKFLNEIAYFCDKINIDEELARLESHISQMRKLLKSDQAEGRRLDFLIQEFNREANTICSKTSNIEVINFGLNMKSEIEKIREQVQNLE